MLRSNKYVFTHDARAMLLGTMWWVGWGGVLTNNPLTCCAKTILSAVGTIAGTLVPERWCVVAEVVLGALSCVFILWNVTIVPYLRNTLFATFHDMMLFEPRLHTLHRAMRSSGVSFSAEARHRLGRRSAIGRYGQSKVTRLSAQLSRLTLGKHPAKHPPSTSKANPASRISSDACRLFADFLRKNEKGKDRNAEFEVRRIRVCVVFITSLLMSHVCSRSDPTHTVMVAKILFMPLLDCPEFKPRIRPRKLFVCRSVSRKKTRQSETRNQIEQCGNTDAAIRHGVMKRPFGAGLHLGADATNHENNFSHNT